MNQITLYYPARLAGEYDSAVSALGSVGYQGEHAELLIRNARVNASEAIVADFGDGRGVTVVATKNGRFQLWQAILAHASEDAAHAAEVGRQLGAALGDGSTIAIFEWRRPVATAHH